LTIHSLKTNNGSRDYYLQRSRLKLIYSRWQKGNSLIELAIVLAVLGLLIAGVFKGNELIEQSRIQKTGMQIENIRSSLELFRLKYGQIPGSFAEAREMISGKCQNGSGRGSMFEGASLSPQSDSHRFWEHLYVANLFLKPTCVTKGGAVCPVTPLGGLWTVQHIKFEEKEGLWLVLGTEHAQTGQGALLTPNRAKGLVLYLTKNGVSDFQVFAKDGADVPSGTCIKDGVFSTESKRACVVYIFLCD
jgi:prepilin-type N-terminal cleavage/methylation domain-containing protein